mgnify:CR=1 FL=1
MADSDTLILVDREDNEIGFAPKLEAHLGSGKLHRAFSLLIFDRQGRLLLQKRAANKMLWGGYWSNTVCSHPRKGEKTIDAAHRRLKEEIGMMSKQLAEACTFIYQVPFGSIGGEHEFLHVYVGTSDDEPTPQSDEIESIRWVTRQELDVEMKDHPERFTPWFAMILERLQKKRIPEGFYA